MPLDSNTLSSKEGFDLLKQLLVDISPMLVCNSEHWFTFLLKVDEILSLSLVPYNGVLISLLPKLPGFCHQFWLAETNRKLDWPQIIKGVWRTFLPNREYEHLYQEKVRRFQFPTESPNEFYCAIQNAAKDLGKEFTDLKLVNLILDGLNPLTKSTLMFMTKPTSARELMSILSYAEKELMNRSEYINTYISPMALPFPRPIHGSRRTGPGIKCHYCNKTGHVAVDCRNRKRNFVKHGITMANIGCANILPKIIARLNGFTCQGLLDTGSSLSLLDDTFWVKIATHFHVPCISKCNVRLKTVGGKQLKLMKRVVLKLQIQKYSWLHEFYITSLPFNLLLGRNFIIKSKLYPNWF